MKVTASAVVISLVWLAHVIAIASGAEHQLDESALTAKQHSLVCYLKKKLEPKFGHSALFSGLVAAKDIGKKSCAIVSSSGAMLHHTYGEEINAHDVIMRFNDAPTKAYESHVGNRTDIRVGWISNPWQKTPAFYDATAEESQFMWPSMAVMQHLYPTNLNQSTIAKPMCTTGFYGMMLALTHCASLDTYEMYPSVFAKQANYHYYGPPQEFKVKADQSDAHTDFAAEHDLWAQLSVTSRKEVEQSGKTKMIGFRPVTCPDDIQTPGSLETHPGTLPPCPEGLRYKLSLTFSGLKEPISDDAISPLNLVIAFRLGQTPFHCVKLVAKKPEKKDNKFVQEAHGIISTTHGDMLPNLRDPEFVEYLCGQVAESSGVDCSITVEFKSLIKATTTTTTTTVTTTTATTVPATATAAATTTAAVTPAITTTASAATAPAASLRATQRLDESAPMQLTAGGQSGAMPWWSWTLLCCGGALALVFCFVPLCTAPQPRAGEDEEPALD
mmetsp:Transcript_19746/g.35789  ORF Transcript_19746/g.35789 Transcript_19746/m.35789 type:complete len:500 (+) Transcript_19746:29-1528(+)